MEQRIRVLIADDHSSSRNALRVLLATQPEVEVVAEAVNGEEALYLVERCRPDVVLMDARMPVLDGLQASLLVKARWPETKVIVVTMYPVHRTEAMAVRADAFVCKADPPERLLAIIGEYRRN